MPPRITLFRDMFKKLIKKEADEWLERNTGWIGDADGVVDVGDGMINVTLNNGNVVKVMNRFAPGRATTPVQIGRSRYLPTIWQVISFRNAFDAPPGENAIKYHFQQHMYGAEDMVPIHRKQITQLTVFPSPENGAFYVVLYGDIRLRSGSYIKISTQLRDLSSYVPTTGAVYVVIESNNTGVLSDNVGDPIASPETASPADIPLPASGKYPQAIILLYEGQSAIEYKDICVPWPTDFNPLDYSGPGHTHTIALDDLSDVTVPSPTDGQVLTFDFYSGEWVAADPTGGSSFNDAEGDPNTVDENAAADGTSTYAARRDHKHLLELADVIGAATGATPVNLDKIPIRVDATGLLGSYTYAGLLSAIFNYIIDQEFFTQDAIFTSHDHTGGEGAQIDHTTLSNIGTNTHAQIDTHIASTSNPHSVTAAQAGAIPRDGWEARVETWTRTGNHTFTVPGDLTAIYKKYTRVQYNDGAVEYGVILSSSHSSGTTTVNLVVNTDYSMAATTITGTYISYLPKPAGFPDAFNWSSSPTITVGSGTLVSKCFPGVDGYMDYEWSLDLNSTTMGALNFTPPAPDNASGSRTPIGIVTFIDASAALSIAGVVLTVGTVFGVRTFDGVAGTYVRQVTISTTIPFTWANSDGLYIAGRYQY